MIPAISIAQSEAPLNKAAEAQFENGELKIIYEGGIILSGKFNNKPEDIDLNNFINESDGKLDQVLIFQNIGESGSLKFEGIISGSEESFFHVRQTGIKKGSIL